MQIAPPGVRPLTVMCTEHQGLAWNMTGISDAVLAVGSSRGAVGPFGPQRERTVATGWWSK